jgi:hypothetical protein
MEHKSPSRSRVVVFVTAAMFPLLVLIVLHVIGYRGQLSSDMGSEIEINFFPRNIAQNVPSCPHKAYIADSHLIQFILLD